MNTSTNHDDLRTRLRGGPDMAPEDTRSELLEDLGTQDLRTQLRGTPTAAPEDTRTELLDEKSDSRKESRSGRAEEEVRRLLEKEERKAADAEAMRQAREDRARAWSPEQAQAQATRDIADHEELAAAGRGDRSDGFYLRSDMSENMKASAAYEKALRELAPQLHARVQENEKDMPVVDVQANLAAVKLAGKERGSTEREQGDASSSVSQPLQQSSAVQTAAAAKPATDAQGQADATQRGLDKQLEDDLRRRVAREQEQAGQGLNAVDVQRTGKELERGDFIMPRRITQAYTEVDGKFFAKDSNRVMFEDKGEKLATSTTDKAAIADMVAYAKAKQWESLKLTGSQEFRREAWLQAESQGIKTQGYTPKQADLASLETLRQERSTNAIAPLQDRRAERPSAAASAASAGATAPRHNLNKNQAAMHVEASKNITTNMEALRKQPGMVDKSVEDLTKLAYWRGVVSEENKLQPKPLQDEALARFDKQAVDPQFVQRLTQETEPKIQEKTTERVQHLDTQEQSL